MQMSPDRLQQRQVRRHPSPAQRCRYTLYLPQARAARLDSPRAGGLPRQICAFVCLRRAPPRTLDPFCGSGTLLFELERAVPTALIGGIFPSARWTPRGRTQPPHTAALDSSTRTSSNSSRASRLTSYWPICRLATASAHTAQTRRSTAILRMRCQSCSLATARGAIHHGAPLASGCLRMSRVSSSRRSSQPKQAA
jgi:hypothetical protein